MVSYRAEDARNLQSVNVQGVRNLIASCERFQKPLIHTSSAIAYGSSIAPICFTEDSSEKDVYRGNYANSKLAADQIVIASKIPYVILRPSTLISTLTNLYNFYKKGFIADLRGGASFAQIEDVARAYVSAIDLLIKFLDYLSWLYEHRFTGESVLVLNSLSFLAAAIKRASVFPAAEVFFDQDDAGRKATIEFLNAVPQAKDSSSCYAGYTDYNEKLMTEISELCTLKPAVKPTFLPNLKVGFSR